MMLSNGSHRSFLTSEGVVLAQPELPRPIVVQKFGGTSVATIGQIRKAASAAIRTVQSGKQVVIVVSAMSGETNRLLALADEFGLSSREERDVLAATGEQAVVALTTMAIREAGGKARGFQGHQVRIVTDSSFGDARIREVETHRLRECLEAGIIPVVAGFQGVDENGRITTLGRGGSDTTALAIAAALGAPDCEIYKDVDGVYTADPAVCGNARRLARVSAPEMMMMATQGAKVLHGRSVAIAMKHGIDVRVLSSFTDGEGTWVLPRPESLEGSSVTSLSCDRNLIELTVDVTGSPASVIAQLTDENIPVHDFQFRNGAAVLVLRTTDSDRVRAGLVASGWRLPGTTPLAKVSLIGHGLQSEPKILARTVRVLSSAGITPLGIRGLENCLSVILRPAQADTAMRILHDEFELGSEASGEKGKYENR